MRSTFALALAFALPSCTHELLTAIEQDVADDERRAADDAPGDPDAPDAPEDDEPEAPDAPDVPNEPDAPDEPSGPDGPDGPDAPAPIEDCYSEPIFPDANISALVGAYGGGDYQDDLVAIMEARHPATAWLLDEQRGDSYFGQFSDSSSWSGMVEWLDTLSHEETHLFNAYEAIDRGVHHVLYLRGDLILELPAPALHLPRNVVLAQLDEGAADGIYAPTYLTGEQGSRGFIPLLDETNAYLSEIGATGSVGEDYPGFGVSLRDGTLALLHFVEVYLGIARVEHPEVWQSLHDVDIYRRAVRLLWQKTHFLMPYADAFANLGIDDDMYRALLHDPAHMNEISLFIGATVADSPCVIDAEPTL